MLRSTKGRTEALEFRFFGKTLNTVLGFQQRQVAAILFLWKRERGKRPFSNSFAPHEFSSSCFVGPERVLISQVDQVQLQTSQITLQCAW
jgi:hypothetical protein